MHCCLVFGAGSPPGSSKGKLGGSKLGKAMSVDDWDNPQPDAQDEDDDWGSGGGGAGGFSGGGGAGKTRSKTALDEWDADEWGNDFDGGQKKAATSRAPKAAAAPKTSSAGGTRMTTIGMIGVAVARGLAARRVEHRRVWVLTTSGVMMVMTGAAVAAGRAVPERGWGEERARAWH